MLTFEQAQQALTDMADAIPTALYEKLNGGILLLPGAKQHPRGEPGALYILGEYHYEPQGMGRYITIYLGSFAKTCAHMRDDELRGQLRRVLHHELQHHIEHLSGDRTLEKQDAEELSRLCMRACASAYRNSDPI